MDQDDKPATIDNFHKELFCVLFPGLVKNDEKALQCLGGVKAISQVYSLANKKRLGLSFQPENPYVKKAYADAKTTSGVLLRVKVKKNKSGNEVKREVISTSVVGSVKKIYTFDSMCDFQYLPITPKAPGSNEFKCALDEILPSGLDDVKKLSEPAPLFIVPSQFTRSDKPFNYSYTEKRETATKSEMKAKEEEVHKMRYDRSLPVTRYTFNLIDDLPTEPHNYYLQMKDARAAVFPQLNQEFDIVKKLFDDRPIWSFNHLKFKTNIKISSLRIILPCLALYMKEGPWRMSWVKYGYDPRKDPEARIYQTLDFRLRHEAGVHVMVSPRDAPTHLKKTDRVRNFKRAYTDEPATDETILEGAVCFRPGLVPTQRQIFYQYCDIHLEEMRQLVQCAAPACHAKHGWLASHTDQLARDLLFTHIKQALLASHNADLKLEQAGSEDDSSSEEELPRSAEETPNF